jgi:hypothetical protein
MKEFILESEAIKLINQKLDEIKSSLGQINKNAPIKDIWLDNQEVSKLLRVTFRTLSTYRTTGILPFSQVGSKIYYRATDVQAHLENHYIKRNGGAL